jgi:hypothetical protein
LAGARHDGATRFHLFVLKRYACRSLRPDDSLEARFLAELDTLVGAGSKPRLACLATRRRTEALSVELLSALSV